MVYGSVGLHGQNALPHVANMRGQGHENVLLLCMEVNPVQVSVVLEKSFHFEPLLNEHAEKLR